MSIAINEYELKRVAFRPTKLDASEDHEWMKTRTAVLINQPFFAHLLITQLRTMFTEDIPTAATDGLAIYINPKFFFALSLQKRVFVVAHEIMHVVWNHCNMGHYYNQTKKVSFPDGSTLPYDGTLMNVAGDLVINDTLIKGHVGEYDKDWLHDPGYGTSTDAVIDVYKKVFQQNPQGGKGGGKGPNGKSFDQVLDPGTGQGKDPGQAAAEREAKAIEWKTAVAQAAQTAKMQGKLPESLARFVDDIMEPQISWQEHIQGWFSRKLGSGGYDWKKPDRQLIVRDIYAPGRSGHGVGTIVVGGDTSGSIGNKTIAMFLGEVGGMLSDLKPKRLIVVWCDAAVGRVDEVEDAADLSRIQKHEPPPGGGGTSFIPVFDWIHEQGLTPDALIYLTDGYGSFPSGAPSYPVLWGSITPEGQVEYPFGDVVIIPDADA